MTQLTNRFIIGCCAGLLAGCASRDTERVFLDTAPVAVKRADGSEHLILFPDYFLLEGFELNDHGHIPRTRLIGAGMTADLDLSAVRTRFSDILHYRNWTTDKLEMGRQSFRILASRQGEAVEIRAVQGQSGATEVFLLYSPDVE